MFELLHFNLVGPMQNKESKWKKYIFVIMDDYSRFPQVLIFMDKSDTLDAFKKLSRKITNEKK